MRCRLILSAALLTGCASEPLGLAVLGFEAEDGEGGDVAEVAIDVLATDADGLNRPRDLAFDPEHPGRLWVVNQADDSVTIVFDAGTPEQTTDWKVDPYALHFMEEVSAIAFGAPGTFATCQESRNTYNDQAPPNDFMGPALWSSDLDVFATSNPEAIDYLTQLFGSYTDLGSHLDMQHETPLCNGIAWERDNAYWVVDGLHGSIDRVDFVEDHGVGYDDHSDGITAEYVPGQIGYLEDVSNHLVLDGERLLIADPANGVLHALDTTSGERGLTLPVTEPGTQHYRMEGADLTTFADEGLTEPSGLALVDGVLFVVDHATGIVHALDAETGVRLDQLDTGRGAGLQGIVAPSLEELWLVDTEANELLRITPQLDEED